MAEKRHPQGRQIGGIFNRNGHWYAKVKIRGRQVWRSAPTREMAQKLLGELREDAARERVGIPKVARVTLQDFAPRYLQWAKANKDSWARDARSLVPLVAALGHFRLPELTKARVEAYMRARREAETVDSARAREHFERLHDEGKPAAPVKAPAVRTLSPATVNREVACLRKLLSYAVDMGELEANPIAGIRLYKEAPGRIPTLEPADESALMAALPDWMRLVVRMAVLTGCRQGELLALRWRHVDFEGATLTVEDSKSGDARRIPLHPALMPDLKARRGLPEGCVVTMANGHPPEAHTVSQAFRRAVRRIGRPDLRFHDTRHVAGSRLLATGASLPEVAATLGHKTLAMSKRYTHVSPVRLAGLIAAMPAPAGPALAGADARQKKVRREA